MPYANALDGVPETLWRLVSLARHRLLMLDYDGTLAPFRAERDEARPLPRSLELTARIAAATHTSVAIVSGRPLPEIEGFLGPIPAVFVGEHGWERRAADGSIARRPLPRSVAATIDRAEQLARAAGWGAWLERKRSAVVLHTRGLPEERAAEIQERCAAEWRGLVHGVHVSVDRIDGGVELRARGRNKGTVVRSLLSACPPGTLGVFVGDDVTDEDAFDAVREQGFGVRVGDSDRPTLAMGILPSCEVVGDFLEKWLAVAAGANGPTGA